jgi:hypothetical protein
VKQGKWFGRLAAETGLTGRLTAEMGPPAMSGGNRRSVLSTVMIRIFEVETGRLFDEGKTP